MAKKAKVLLKIQYQYYSWSIDDTLKEHWCEMEMSCKTQQALKSELKKLNDKYSAISFKSDDMEHEIDNNTIVCYTDGSCDWKTQEGGIGVYMKLGELEHIISEGYKYTKTGRMELTGIIRCLQEIKDKDAKIIIHCDSQYAINTSSNWIHKWKKIDNFAGKANKDLLIILLEELNKFSNTIDFKWVKGHSGIEGNEIADMLAEQGRLSLNK